MTWDAREDPALGRVVAFLDAFEGKLDAAVEAIEGRLDTARPGRARTRDTAALEAIVVLVEAIGVARARVCDAAWTAAHPAKAKARKPAPAKARKRKA